MGYRPNGYLLPREQRLEVEWVLSISCRDKVKERTRFRGGHTSQLYFANVEACLLDDKCTEAADVERRSNNILEDMMNAGRVQTCLSASSELD